ncbi:MAG: PD-(D/E)XK nuclease family protein [Bacteroidia bacterium]
MKSNLLNKVLNDYVSDVSDKKDRVVFVLPSKRSIYVAKHILKDIFIEKNKTAAFPEMITINEFMEKLTGLIILSNIDLLYYLYLSYKKFFNNENANPYHSFVKWAGMLLNDFNDVLISHPDDNETQNRIFTNLKDIREIEHWSLNREPLSENQKSYLDLMNKFYSIFTDFNTSLINNGYAYGGLNMQEAVRMIKEGKCSYVNEVGKFVFVGLNAITPAEKIIFNHLKKHNKADFYWDYDEYYTDNSLHEAGKFLRENFKEFGINENNKQTESYFTREKNIQIASANNDVEEALYVKKVLADLKSKNSSLDDTAIILHKPESLHLILSAIPEDVEYNVSMEYPLYLTPAYQFVMQMLRIFVQLPNSEENSNRIYHKQFINLFLNPFFKDYAYRQLQVSDYVIDFIVDAIKKQNRIYISIDDEKFFCQPDEKAGKNIKDKFLIIFKERDINKIVSNINDWLDAYLNTLRASDGDYLTINVVQTISGQLSRIEDIVKTDNGEVFRSIKDIYVLIQQILSREAVAFKGEPLKGLQIIGLLESRLLDFENIVIPFMNEGVFPPDHQKISFLPYDLRMYYQLPTHHNDDAIFSYLFYRNLHQPSHIFLSYNNSESRDEKGIRTNAGEQSRYIQQIIYELSQHKNIHISNVHIQTAAGNNTGLPITINKTEGIIAQLKSIQYSPTSISTYIDCSLKFYFNYVLKLKKEDETAEELQADMEGKIFHKVMSEVYSKLDVLKEDKTIDTNKLKQLIEQPQEIFNIIDKEIKEQNLEMKGKVLIQEALLKEDILQFLKRELESILKNNSQIQIIYTEGGDSTDKKMVALNNIQLYGIPDRIDYVKNESLYRIVDYKSSFSPEYDKMDYQDLIDKLDDINENKKNINKQLQLLIYMYYAIQSGMIPSNAEYLAGVILPLRLKAKNENDRDINRYVQMNESHKIDKNGLQKIVGSLNKIFDDWILHPQKPFTQTSNTYICQYCQFADICKR